VTGDAPQGEPVDHRTRGFSISSRKRQAPTLLVLFAVSFAVAVAAIAGSATANPSIASKQAQARAVLGQIQEIQGRVERASNALYAANHQLDQIQGSLSLNTQRLGVARQSLSVAQTRVASRLRALYMQGTGGGTVEILLGAQNLDDLLNRIDAAKRVNRQDSVVLHQVRGFRKEVERRQVELRAARIAQTKLVAERAAQKRTIEGQLEEQNRLYASIKDEIAKLKAEEARRQALLAAQARARYLAALRAQQAQAALAASVSAQAVSSDAQPAPPTGLSSESPPPPPSQYGGAVGIALQYLGTPYVWGASGPGAFDCSGFTSYVYGQLGVSLPHNAAAQYSYGAPVSRDQLQPGDLVFFDGLGHVGLYIGGGQFVHAPHTGDVVKISSMSDSWYAATFVGARRL
jgi:cell wall-associated NlpC family hydrolase